MVLGIKLPPKICTVCKSQAACQTIELSDKIEVAKLCVHAFGLRLNRTPNKAWKKLFLIASRDVHVDRGRRRGGRLRAFAFTKYAVEIFKYRSTFEYDAQNLQAN